MCFQNQETEPSNIQLKFHPQNNLLSFGAKPPNDNVKPPNSIMNNEARPSPSNAINNAPPLHLDPVKSVQANLPAFDIAYPPDLTANGAAHLSQILSSTTSTQPSNLSNNSNDQTTSVQSNTTTSSATNPSEVTNPPEEVKPKQRNIEKLGSGASTTTAHPPVSTTQAIKPVSKTRKIVRKKYVDMRSRQFPSILLQLCSQDYGIMASHYQMVWSKYPLKPNGGKGYEAIDEIPNSGSGKPSGANGLPHQQAGGAGNLHPNPAQSLLNDKHPNPVQSLMSDNKIGPNRMQPKIAEPSGVQKVNPQSSNGNLAPPQSLRINGGVADNGLLGTNNEWRGAVNVGTDGRGVPFLNAQHSLTQDGVASPGAPGLEKLNNVNNSPGQAKTREINGLNRDVPVSGSALETPKANGSPVGGANQDQNEDRALPNSLIMNAQSTTGGTGNNNQETDTGETCQSTTPNGTTTLSFLQKAMLVFTVTDEPAEENEQYLSTNPEETTQSENPQPEDQNVQSENTNNVNNEDTANQPVEGVNTNTESEDKSNIPDQVDNAQPEKLQIEKPDMNGDNAPLPTESGVTVEPSPDVTENDRSGDLSTESNPGNSEIEGEASSEPANVQTTASPEYGENDQATSTTCLNDSSSPETPQDNADNSNTNTDDTQTRTDNGSEQNANVDAANTIDENNTNVGDANNTNDNVEVNSADNKSNDAVNEVQSEKTNVDNTVVDGTNITNEENVNVESTNDNSNVESPNVGNENTNVDNTNGSNNENVENTNAESTNENSNVESTNDYSNVESTNSGNDSTNVDNGNYNETVDKTNGENDNLNVENRNDGSNAETVPQDVKETDTVNTEQNQDNDITQPPEGNAEYVPSTDIPQGEEQQETSENGKGDVQPQDNADGTQSSDPPSYDGEITTVPAEVNNAEAETTSQQDKIENIPEDKAKLTDVGIENHPEGNPTVIETDGKPNAINKDENNLQTNVKSQDLNDLLVNMNKDKVNTGDSKNNIPESIDANPKNNIPDQIEKSEKTNEKEEPRVDKTKIVESPPKEVLNTEKDVPKIEKQDKELKLSETVPNKEEVKKEQEAIANPESNDKTMEAPANIHSPEHVDEAPKTENGEGRNIKVMKTKKDESSDGKRSIVPIPKQEDVPKPVVENKSNEKKQDEIIPSDNSNNKLEQNQEPPPKMNLNPSDERPVNSPLVVPQETPKEEVKPVVLDKEKATSPETPNAAAKDLTGNAQAEGKVKINKAPSQSGEITDITQGIPKLRLGKDDRTNLNVIGAVPSDQGPSGPGWNLFGGLKYPYGSGFGQYNNGEGYGLYKKRVEATTTTKTTTTTTTTTPAPVQARRGGWAWF